MSRALTRAERLQELERLYQQRAYSDIEMAARLGVTRATVWKDRTLLEAELPFVREPDGRWRIDRTRYLSNIRLNLYEALALYLAARRSSRQTQPAQPHTAGALEKLAAALRQPMAQQLVRAADQVLAQRRDPASVAILEKVATAWVEQRRLRIWYQALDASGTKQHLVAPYLIEPSQWSDSTYLIGHSDRPDDILAFKLERIRRASLTSHCFTLPAEFDEARLLQHAWGIWYADSEPTLVQLKFAAGRATRRVKESIWHPAETIQDTEDGGTLWQAPVAEWQEMLPWIRGWGADCEVLAPVELRETVLGEARRLARIYGWAVHRIDRTASGEDYDDQRFRDIFG